jgi:hypothetical protein
MKRQFLAIGLATISAVGTFSSIDPVSAQSPVQPNTIEVRVDRADTAPVAFDPGNSIEARPDMFLRVFVDGERIAFSTAPENQSSAKFNLRASGRSTKSFRYQEYIYERVSVAGDPQRSEDAVQDIFHKVANSQKKVGDILND